METKTTDVKEAGQTMLGQGFVKDAREKSDLSKDDFMKLLLAQMQNQDPLAPQDSKEYLAQLAQLSSLEQLENINDSISTMSIVEAAGTNSQTVNYIGKTVTIQSNELTVSESGKPTTEMSYELEADAESVDITITNESGTVVRTIKHGSKGTGRQTVEWDGKDNSGNPLPEGKYNFDIAAVGNDGEKVEGRTFVKGIVTAVTYENGYPEIQIGKAKATLGAVVSVDQPTTQVEETEAKITITPRSARVMEKYFTGRATSNNMFNIKK